MITEKDIEIVEFCDHTARILIDEKYPELKQEILQALEDAEKWNRIQPKETYELPKRIDEKTAVMIIPCECGHYMFEHFLYNSDKKRPCRNCKCNDYLESEIERLKK